MTSKITTMRPLESAAALTSGGTFWATKPDERGQRVVLTDGPHGVRHQEGQADHLGLGASEPATCFPPAAGLAQSWDRTLVEQVGRALGTEARHFGVGVLLGPGVNIRRDPRGGRNFEYFSEDPILTGELGSAWVKGVQSAGVGASLKHFAANNCETDRMRSDSVIAERALREIYLRAFEIIVKEVSPWTVMCSYNKLNGELVSQNRWLLHDVLRGEWGFDGVVVSDWGAVADRVAAVRAGTDLAMPGGASGSGDADIVRAVEDGMLDHESVEQAAGRVAALIERAAESARTAAPPLDFEAHHTLAREAASRSVVLLKNDGGLLPLKETARIAVIGPQAEKPRYQGGGSSHVNAVKVDVPLEEIRLIAGEVEFAAGIGWPLAQAEAVDTAARAEVAVLFLGLDESDESEGFDRSSLALPEEQVELLRAVVSAQPRTVIVLSHGGVVDLTEAAKLAPSILDGALLGEGGGWAVAQCLFGRRNPSGKLSETVPVRLQDVPAFLNFPGEHSRVVYGEGIFVGYRGYDSRALPVTFPFGHGLSYTCFEYGPLTASVSQAGIDLSVTVTNIGDSQGREVAQFYVGKDDSAVRRAPLELAAFESVDLQPGESAVVTARISRPRLAYWEDRTHQWHVEGGKRQIWAASSSRDLRSTIEVSVQGDVLRLPLSANSTLGELAEHPVGAQFFKAMRQISASPVDTNSEVLGSDMERLAAQIPLNRLATMSGGATSLAPDALEAMLAQANS